MNKRQKKKFKKKGYHRKCLEPNEIVFLGLRLKKCRPVVCNKSELPQMTPNDNDMRELGIGLRRKFDLIRNAFYSKFLNEEDDKK